jgi:hypothetical protein
MSEIAKKISPWYFVNFTNDLFFDGKTTRFLRVNIPHADVKKIYYVTLVPVFSYLVSESSPAISNNLDINDFISQYNINGVNTKDVYDNIINTNQNYDCINLFGTSNTLFFGTSANIMTAPDPKHWERISSGDSYEYRIDYLGGGNEMIKFVMLVSEYEPKLVSGVYKFVKNNQAFPNDVANIEPVGISEWNPTLELGIKSINEYLYGSDTFSSIDTVTNTADIFHPIQFDYVDLEIKGIANIKQDFRENISSQSFDTIISNDKTSSMMLRTNPLLSGNIKLTVEESGNLSLNSFDANTILSDLRFKKFIISSNSSYATDVYKFLDNGALSPDVVFDVYEYDKTYVSTKNEYNLQYDNFYSYGVSQCTSKLYDEEFSLLAPIWLKQQVPDYFVIFKIDHSINLASYDLSSTATILSENLANAKIIKTFDLRRGSKLGTYIRNIIDNSLFSEQPLYVSYDKDILTSWKGISYENGAIGEKGEFLYDYLKQDRTIKEFDEYISSGFKRNKIICQNLMNIEFLFNDKDSAEYSLNRYFGLYVNETQLSQFEIDYTNMKFVENQSPSPRTNVDITPFATNDFIQHNDNGVRLSIAETDNILNISNDPGNELQSYIDESRFFVVKTKDTEFKRIKDIEINNKTQNKELVFYDNDLNITKFTGIDEFKQQYPSLLLDESSSQFVLSLATNENAEDCILEPGEELIIKNVKSIDFNEWRLVANPTGSQSGDWWDYPVYDVNLKAHIGVFNPTGTPEIVAKAIAGAINQFEDNFFEAVAIGNKVYIRTIEKSDSTNSYTMTRKMTEESFASTVKFYDKLYTGETLEYSSFFIGGNTRKRNRAKIDITKAESISASDWFQCQRKLYSKVKSYDILDSEMYILPYLDEPIYNEHDVLIGFTDILKYATIELNDEYEFYVNDNKITAYSIFTPSFSILSLFPIKNFDFDFYNMDYAYTPIAELYKYFNSYSIETGGSAELSKDHFYKVISGSGVLRGYENGVWVDVFNISAPNPDLPNDSESYFNTLTESFTDFDITSRLYLGYHSYEKLMIVNTGSDLLRIVNFLYSRKSIDDLRIVENNLDLDIIDFKGFSGLKPMSGTSLQAEIDNYVQQDDIRQFTKQLLSTEYDRLNENYLKDYAIKSKVVPYINKWVASGTDVHNNKYRLNMSSAFGQLGFSPIGNSLSDTEQYSHEWYYLDRHPSDFSIENYKSSRSYMFNMLDDIPFNSGEYSNLSWKTLLYNTDVDFFTKYFTIGNPCDNNISEDIYREIDERYVYTYHLSGVDEIECIFRGAKLKLKELDEDGQIASGSRKYENYKFTAILSLKDNVWYRYNEPYSIEIIDNQKFKTIAFVVTIYLQDYKFNKNLSYTSLYSAINAFNNDNVYKNDYDSLSYYKEITPTTFNEPLYQTSFSYKKQLKDNNYVTVVDMKDTESFFNIDRGYKIYKERYSDSDLSMEFFRLMSAGNLQSPFTTFARLYDSSDTNSTLLNYGNVVSFEGFLDKTLSDTELSNYRPESAYPSLSKVTPNRKNIVYSIFHDIMSPFRFGPYYTSDVTYTTDEISVSGDILFTKVDENLIGYYSLPLDTNLAYLNPQWWPISQLNNDDEIYIFNGGELCNKEILDLVSFSSIKDKVNNGHDFIKRISILESGEIVYDKFLLEFINQSKIVKENLVNSVIDKNKPSSLSNVSIIGYDLEKTNNKESLLRHGGLFGPKMDNVIVYNMNEPNDMKSFFNREFILSNTSININNESNFIYKNMFINKINDIELFDLGKDFSYYNVYPLIGEVSIDKKDHNLFLSCWDNSFYRKYNTKTSYTDVSGLYEMQEIKTFFGSKVMNVPDVYSLDLYNANEYSVSNENQSVKNIQNLDNSKLSISVSVDNVKRLIRKMNENGIDAEFNWIKNNSNSFFKDLTETEFSAYIESYIQKNILQLYEIDKVTIYSKISEKTNNQTYNLDFYVTEAEVLNTYSNDKYSKFEKLNENSLNINITIDIDSSVFKTYAIVVKIKRK